MATTISSIMTNTFSYDDAMIRELTDDLETEVIDLQLDNLYENFEEDNIQHQFHIPDYLSITNLSFQTTFFSVLRCIYNPIHFEDLQQLAILTHHMSIIHLHKQLWHCYLQSGTGQLKKLREQHSSSTSTRSNNNITLSLWPTIVRSIMISKGILNINKNNNQTNDHDIYINFIHKYLQYLDNKANQYQIQFNTIKNRLPGYSDAISYKIDEFVQKEGVIAMRLYYQTKIAFIEYMCIDQFFQYEFFQQKPTNSQLQLAKYIYQLTLEKEKTEQELILFKVGILYKKLPKSLDILEEKLPISITSISDLIIRERLSNQYIGIIQRAKADLMIVLTTAAEARRHDKQKNFDKQMTEIWKDQHQIPHAERLTTAMLTLIDQQQKNITECVKCIYAFKGTFSLKV